MKKVVLGIFLFIFIGIIIFTNSIETKAHSRLLDVEYDECNPNLFCDGDDEVWYYQALLTTVIGNEEIYKVQFYYHFPQVLTTITYFVSDTAKQDDSYSWDTDVSEEEAIRIQNTYVQSMLKWNDVYSFF